MKAMRVADIAAMTGGRVAGDGAVQVEAVSTDTRQLPDAQQRAVLFVALKGANFDGHDHVRAALARGAAAALVSQEIPNLDAPQVIVADTERALGALAAQLQRTHATKVAAITGSNGKTSVKTLLVAIMQAAGPAYANPGNFNNEIGLPLAVIDAPEDVPFAVYEMGAGKPGDIAYLTQVVRPDVALVNNIAPAHLERMGTLAEVANTKAAIYDALPADGVAVINADEPFAAQFAERAHGHRILRFALDAQADVTARGIALTAQGGRFTLVTPAGEAQVQLAMPGRHSVGNALAAATLALALGIALPVIARGLEAAQPVQRRLAMQRLGNGALLIDDSYNANPGSVAAAIDTLCALPGEAWLVLGDMRELGAEEAALHAGVGRRARKAGITRVFALGELSAAAAQAFGEGAQVFESHAAIIDALRPLLHSGINLLVKGSNGSAMHRVARALQEASADVA